MKGIKIMARRLNEMRPWVRHELIYMADKDLVMAVPCYTGTWFFPEGLKKEQTYHFASAIRYGDETLEIRFWDTDEIIEKKGCISWAVLAAQVDDRKTNGWGKTIAEELEEQKNG